MNSKVKTILKIGLTTFLVVGFLFYGLFKSRGLIAGPKITLESPREGATGSQKLIEVVGKASNVAAVFLNGNQIYTDDKGEFKESIILAQGYNVITVDAKDKFGRETKETREVFINN